MAVRAKAARLLRTWGERPERLRGPVAFGLASPDGNLVAASDGGGSLRLWDAASGALVADLGAEAFDGVFSPDGRHLLVRERLGLRLRRVPDGAPLAEVDAGGRLAALALSPDARRAATVDGGRRGGACVWDLTSGQLLRRTERRLDASGRVPGPASCAFSPDGSRVAFSARWSDGPEVEVSDPAGRRLWAVRCPGATVAFSPDGRYLLACAADYEAVCAGPDAAAPPLERRLAIHVWEAATGAPVRTVWGHHFAAVTDDGRLVTGRLRFSPPGIALADLETGAAVDPARPRRVLVSSDALTGLGLALFPDARRAVACGAELRVVDLETGVPVWRRAPAPAVRAIAFSGDGRGIVWATHDGDIHRVDAASGDAQEVIVAGEADRRRSPERRSLAAIAFPQDGGRAVAVAPGNRRVAVWDLARGQVERVVAQEHLVAGGPVPFATDGAARTVLGPAAGPEPGAPAARASQRLRCAALELESGRSGPPLGEGTWPQHLALSPDGRWAVGDAWGPRPRDVWSGAEGPPLEGAAAPLRWPTFSPDGRLLAGSQGGLHLWEVASGRRLRTLQDADAGPCAFSRDGRRLVAVSSGLRVFDLATGAEIDEIWTSADGLVCAALSPDGRMVAAGGGSGVVMLFALGDAPAVVAAPAPPPAEAAPSPAEWKARADAAAADAQVPLEEVVRLYRRALEGDPRQVDGWRQLGVVLAMAGRVDEALEAFDRGLALAPADLRLLEFRVVALNRARRFPAALESCDRFLAAAPESAKAWAFRAAILRQSGRLAEARAAAIRAVELEPRQVAWWIEKAEVERAREDPAEETAAWRAALALGPPEPARSRIAERLAALEAPARLAAELDVQRRLQELWGEATARLRAQRFEEALPLFDQVIALRPDFDGPWFNKGLALAGLARWPEAIACFRRTLEIHPQHVEALDSLGDALARTGAFDEALACHERILALAGQPPPIRRRALAGKAACLRRLGRDAEAFPLYVESLQTRLDDADLLREALSLPGVSPAVKIDLLAVLADAAVGARRFDRALPLFEQIIERRPLDQKRLARAWAGKGICLRELGQPAQALPCLDRAMQLDPSDKSFPKERSSTVAALGRVGRA